MTGISHPNGLEGHSFVPLLKGDEDNDRAAFSEFYPGRYPAERMIRTGPWKYIYTHHDVDQLYHMEDDPSEMHNLAPDPAYRSHCEKFRARVMEGWDIDAFEYIGE